MFAIVKRVEDETAVLVAGLTDGCAEEPLLIRGKDACSLAREANRKADIKISIVVVNFNGGHLLSSAVAAALGSSVTAETIVVDNASTDGSLEWLLCAHGPHPRLTIIRGDRNVGFARAANLALRRVDTPFVLLLNPDCVIEQSTLERLLPSIEQDPAVGVVGCLLRNRDGTEQAGCRRAVPTPWRTLVRVLHLDRMFPGHPLFRNFVLSKDPLPSTPTCVEAISGAFMLVRRKALAQIGLLDEGYFLHCEDLDWCFRFRSAGWKVLFVPDVEVLHHGGVCGADRPIFVHWHKHKGMVRFYTKFFRQQYPSMLMALVVGAVWSRFAVLASYELIKVAHNVFKSYLKRYAAKRDPLSVKNN